MKKQIIKGFLTGILGIAEAIAIIKQMNKTIVRKEKNNAERLNINFKVLNAWMRVKQGKTSLAEHLEQKGIKKVAIYGMAEIGELLYQELDHSHIQAAYAIDKNSTAVRTDRIRVIGLEDDFEPVDAIIVTVIYYFPEVKKELGQKTDIPVLSLEDILNEILVDG